MKVLRCRTARSLLVLVVGAFGALCCYSQTAQPAIQGPSLKAEEASLDFVVHDKKQRSVLDLRPEEVAVTDDGEAVKLTSLRLINSGEENGHLITLVFDHLSPTVKKNASEVAGKILKGVPQGNFSLAVLKIEPGRLGLLQAFTPDRNALNQAVTAALEPDTSTQRNAFERAAEDRLMEVVKTGIDPQGKHVSASERTLARTMFDVLQDSARTVQEQHAQSYLSELLALVESQQKMAGHKRNEARVRARVHVEQCQNEEETEAAPRLTLLSRSIREPQQISWTCKASLS